MKKVIGFVFIFWGIHYILEMFIDFPSLNFDFNWLPILVFLYLGFTLKDNLFFKVTGIGLALFQILIMLQIVKENLWVFIFPLIMIWLGFQFLRGDFQKNKIRHNKKTKTTNIPKEDGVDVNQHYTNSSYEEGVFEEKNVADTPIEEEHTSKQEGNMASDNFSAEETYQSTSLPEEEIATYFSSQRIHGTHVKKVICVFGDVILDLSQRRRDVPLEIECIFGEVTLLLPKEATYYSTLTVILASGPTNYNTSFKGIHFSGNAILSSVKVEYI